MTIDRTLGEDTNETSNYDVTVVSGKHSKYYNVVAVDAPDAERKCKLAYIQTYQRTPQSVTARMVARVKTLDPQYSLPHAIDETPATHPAYAVPGEPLPPLAQLWEGERDEDARPDSTVDALLSALDSIANKDYRKENRKGRFYTMTDIANEMRLTAIDALDAYRAAHKG